MATFPTLSQPGAQMQTVPGGGSQSMNLNPLGQAPMSQVAQTSPVAATLPTIPSGVSGTTQGGFSSNPGLQLVAPGGLLGPGGTPGSSTPITSGTAPTNINTPMNQANPYTMLGDFQQTYGSGTGSYLASLLGNLGTSGSMALQTMDKAALDAAQRQWGSMEAGMGARGVSADSSTAALASGDFEAQVNQNLAANAAQIGLQEQNTLINALQTEGAKHGTDVSGFQTFMNSLGTIGNVAGAVSQGFGVGGTAGSILDTLAAL